MNPPVFEICKGDSNVTALLGTDPLRVYPFAQAPENKTYPYATYGIVAGVPDNTMDSVPLSDVVATQVDVWAKTAAECEEIATAIRDACEPEAHMTAFGSGDRDAETKSYHLRLEFDFFINRQ